MGFNSCIGVDRRYVLSSAVVHKNVPGKSGATALWQIMKDYRRYTQRVKGKTLKMPVCSGNSNCGAITEALGRAHAISFIRKLNIGSYNYSSSSD